MIDWSTITLERARALVQEAQVKDAEEARLFYEGDHWQGSKGWFGPRPEPTARDGAIVWSEIEAGFVSKNTTAEIVDRHVNALLGRDVAWSMSPDRPMAKGEELKADKKKRKLEAEGLLTPWWIRRTVHAMLKDGAARLLWGGRSLGRLRVPRGLLREGRRVQVPAGDFAAALDLLYFDVIEAKAAAVVTDEDTMQEAGIFVYDEETTEGQKLERVSICYLDENGGTVIRTMGTGVAPEDAIAGPYPLGGRLTLFELERRPLVTPQVKQLQKLENLGLSMLPRNVVLGGFLERVILNAQLPGKYVADADYPGGRRFVPDPINVGAGTTNSWSGIAIKDAEGKTTGVATPSVIYRDPVPVDTFRDTKGIAYEAMLEEAHQRHVLMVGDGAASGESRKQARADFEQSLKDTKTEVEGEVVWLLETALALAASFAGRPGYFDGLRAVAECRIDVGPRIAEDDRMTIELHDSGIISRETAQVRVGVEDVGDENRRIEQERAADLERGRQAARTSTAGEDEPGADGENADSTDQRDEAA